MPNPWIRERAHFLVSGVLALIVFGNSSASAEEWRAIATLVAPEAKQAAAADDRFAYAIDNSVVAKYDRATGAKIATSVGAAKHLNSGFFWNGRLFCAHSNFPLTPEHSEIKVLDPTTMRLETFKDFGNYGGSLTWAVREHDEWWCNFARYGADNGQSFLVRFDDQWQEKSRYRYPPELVAQLGKYSLSGAVWRSGELLATDHDHPRIYRLRLPQKGDALDYLGSISAPFAGQGFALDPATGGLVGIRRKTREIVFANIAAPAESP